MESSNPPARDTLSGCDAVVTGGCRGLGRAIAETLFDSGAQVTVLDLESAIAESDLPDEWRTEAVDFASDDFEKRIEEIARDFQKLDILVANAGVVPAWRGVAELDFNEWETVFRINVAGVAFTLKHFAPALAESGNGSAVLMASVNAYKGHSPQTLYVSTKHAVLGIARAAALDLGPRGVRVNAIAPGPVATDALLSRIRDRHERGEPALDEVLSDFASNTALGRLARPEDVAEVALFLSSNRSQSITGQLFPVESGLK